MKELYENFALLATLYICRLTKCVISRQVCCHARIVNAIGMETQYNDTLLTLDAWLYNFYQLSSFSRLSIV